MVEKKFVCVYFTYCKIHYLRPWLIFFFVFQYKFQNYLGLVPIYEVKSWAQEFTSKMEVMICACEVKIRAYEVVLCL